MAGMLWNWTAADPMWRFRSAVDRLFETFGEGEEPWRGAWEAYPRMAAYDVGARYVIEAELPGVRMEDLEITCMDRTLTVRGERSEEEASGESYERRERPAGTFLRTIELPDPVDSGKTEATLEEGILRIAVPKAESASPRRIEIRTSAQRADSTAAAKEQGKESAPNKEEK